MKFSLLTLILVVLVCALSVNCLVLYQKSEQLNEQEHLTTAEIGNARRELQIVQSRIAKPLDQLLYKLRTDLETSRNSLAKQFQQFRDSEGQLEIDESKLAIKQLPRFSRDNRFETTYRIFVPEAMQLSLQAKLSPTVDFASSPHRFLQTDSASIQLPAGLSELQLTMVKYDEEENGEFGCRISLCIDGETRKEWRVKGNKSWFGITASTGHFRYQQNYSEVDNVKLVTAFRPSQSDHQLDLTITNRREQSSE